MNGKVKNEKKENDNERSQEKENQDWGNPKKTKEYGHKSMIKGGRCVTGRHVALGGFQELCILWGTGKERKAIQARPQSQQGKGEGGATNYPSQQEGVVENKTKKISSFRRRRKKIE